MKEQKETTFSEKSDDFSKAISYSKRLLKNKLYHSNTIEQKLHQKYTNRVVNKTMSYLNEANYFDNNFYVNKLKDLCIKKYYGIRRFKQILNDKGIYSKEHVYTFKEESKVLRDFLEICSIKYSKLDKEEYIKKITYLVKYKGFSKFNITKYFDTE